MTKKLFHKCTESQIKEKLALLVSWGTLQIICWKLTFLLQNSDLLNPQVLQKRSKSDPDIFEDLNMPIDQIEVKCENKNCRSTDKVENRYLFKTKIMFLVKDWGGIFKIFTYDQAYQTSVRKFSRKNANILRE